MGSIVSGSTFQIPDLIKERIHLSFERRKNILGTSTAARMIFSESDLLPGLIVDNYSGHFVVQFLSAGIERFRDHILGILCRKQECLSVYERSDSSSRAKEGLPKISGQIYGTTPALVEFSENGIYFLADVRKGHKTGFYLDQKISRGSVASLSDNKIVMNCFSYTGGFGVAMQNRPRKIFQMDASKDALELARENEKLNKIKPGIMEYIEADIFEFLRSNEARQIHPDLVILDPPKFAENAAQVPGAARGYKDINRLALGLLKRDGLLASFSCSGHMERSLFQKIIADAALDANHDIQYIQNFSQSPDHPVLASFPESEYLRGFLSKVI